MTSPPPRSAARAARGLRLWIGLLGFSALAVGVLLFLARPAPAERAYRRGLRLLRSGQSAAAAEEFERAVRLRPGFLDAWHAWLDAAPTPDVCRRFARHWPELFDPSQPLRDPALIVRGRGWDAARWRRSLAVYQSTVRAISDDHNVLRMDLLGREKLAGAWEELRKVAAKLDDALKYPPGPDLLRPFVTYDLRAAQRTLTDLLSDFKDSEQWLALTARMAEAIDDEEKGLALLRRASKAAPAFVPSQLTLAYVDITRGKPAEAEARCRLLLRLRDASGVIPGEVRIRYCSARALELLGRYDAAAAQVSRIRSLRPADVDAALRLGALYLKAGRVKQADAIADELMEQSEFDTRASRLKGMASFRLGDYATAVSELLLALKLDPADLGARYCLALARLRNGQYSAASSEFLRVAEQTADAGWPTAAAAAAALATGHGETAQKLADAVWNSRPWLRAHPKLREYAARFRIGGLLLQGKYQAVEPLVRAFARETTNKELANYLTAAVWVARDGAASEAEVPVTDEHLAYFRSVASGRSARYCLAFLLAASGQVGRARSILEPLVAKHPDYALAALHLACLYLLEGKTERAARVLDRPILAERVPDAARTLALIDSLQGLRLLRPAARAGSGPDRGQPLLGPQLVLSSAVLYEDYRQYARRVLLTDPTTPFVRDLLLLTYPYIRRQGVGGVAAAVAADPSGRRAVAIRRSLAAYHAARDGVYRLVIGDFWSDMPPDL